MGMRRRRRKRRKEKPEFEQYGKLCGTRQQMRQNTIKQNKDQKHQ